eukprot:692844-Hanusia_phi.AAC.2
MILITTLILLQDGSSGPDGFWELVYNNIHQRQVTEKHTVSLDVSANFNIHDTINTRSLHTNRHPMGCASANERLATSGRSASRLLGADQPPTAHSRNARSRTREKQEKLHGMVAMARARHGATGGG